VANLGFKNLDIPYFTATEDTCNGDNSSMMYHTQWRMQINTLSSQGARLPCENWRHMQTLKGKRVGTGYSPSETAWDQKQRKLKSRHLYVSSATWFQVSY